MSCNGCEQNVTDALTDTDGVDRAEADHEVDTVEVTDDSVTDDDIRAAVEEAGYEVTAWPAGTAASRRRLRRHAVDALAREQLLRGTVGLRGSPAPYRE